MAYSLALRQRIVEAVECGGSTKRAIGLFGVHKTFIDRLPRQRRECDDLAPLPQSDVVSPKLTQADLPLHYDLVAAAPAATLAKRSQQLKKQARIALRNAPH